MSSLETDPLLRKHPTKSTQYLRENRNTNTSSQAYSVGKAGTGHIQQLQLQQNGQAPQDIDPSDTTGGSDTTPLSLSSFYELIGMQPPDSHGRMPQKLAAAHGLYKEICDREGKTNRKYRMFDIMIMVLIVMQLVISAVFILLGSLHIDHHITIAVLGAVGTVLAGILALVKGQGLPNRLRMERDGLRKVIFEAEELYWDVGAGRSVTFGDIRQVRAAYLAVLEDARRNHPDTWTAAAAAEAGLAKPVSKVGGTVTQSKTVRPISAMAKI